MFRNPLASPELLGTSTGAVLGAHIALLISVLALGGGSMSAVLPEMLIPIGAVLGAVLSLGALLIVQSYRRDPLALILTGYALSSMFSGMSSFLSSMTRADYEINAAFSALVQGDISAAGDRKSVV
jgi:iron complex transport system permease protein